MFNKVVTPCVASWNCAVNLRCLEKCPIKCMQNPQIQSKLRLFLDEALLKGEKKTR